MKQFLTTVSLAVCMAGGFGAAVLAESPGTSDTVHQVRWTVRLGDLDLHSQAGAKTAAWRIQLAADYVCGGYNRIGRQIADFIPCREDAINRALDTLNQPMVSAAMGRKAPVGMASR
jgi:UrcA family protein